MTLTEIAFYLFAAIAAGGVGMALMMVARLKMPGFFGPAHGVGGLAACALLFAANLMGGDATPARAWWALGVFTAGLVGGLLLFRVLFRGNTPAVLIAGHGSVAALGLYLLYGVVFPA